jgi:hypothetical protein
MLSDAAVSMAGTFRLEDIALPTEMLIKPKSVDGLNEGFKGMLSQASLFGNTRFIDGAAIVIAEMKDAERNEPHQLRFVIYSNGYCCRNGDASSAVARRLVVNRDGERL